MNIEKRIELLGQLGDFLLEEMTNKSGELSTIVYQTFIENKWFTETNQWAALEAIATKFLNRDLLKNWVKNYTITDSDYPTKTVGIVMAGNIPLVGFQDWLCVFISGQKGQIKLSEKDKRLFPFLIKKLAEFDFQVWDYVHFTERLADFDAVIATGSNNTSRYFEQYFAKYPHIIRRNRNSVAVLDGSESMAELYALGTDIFTYFGLGCRNVTKLFVPKNYVFHPLLEATHEWKELAMHDKWLNNFDYSTTLFLLNKIPYLNNGCLILREEKTFQSRISTVHYEFYENDDQLLARLNEHRSEIQCIVGRKKLAGFDVLPFGETQKPGLSDYPDGVDIMQFLNKTR